MFFSLFLFLLLPWYTLSQGQVPLDPGLQLPRIPIQNTLGGVYSSNITLFFRNSPYRVMTDLTVEVGATLTIETGVQLYFDTGVGLQIKGSIHAIGNEFAHIQMLPHQQQLVYDEALPQWKLIDGPTVRQGRLQVRFRDRWRSVCTQLTNWTSIDTGAACRSMGYGDGGFWKWFRRNNDTFPAVMPRPNCHPGAKELWECPGLFNQDSIPLSENLCQGEDDIGIICWGPPTFKGWARHWKGLRIFNSPFGFVNSDPDQVAVHKESHSRLEFVDILYGGYDGTTKNVTSALWIEGVPPIMNGIRVEKSARDGVYFYEPGGPILIANSTVSWNRGHGIVVDNTTDGRVFINMTLIENNHGDGIWYKHKIGGGIEIEMMERARSRRQLSDFSSLSSLSGIYDVELPRVDICQSHTVPKNLYFPHLLRAFLKNGTVVDPSLPSGCWIVISLPPRLPYTYSLQFVHIKNRNPKETETNLIVCDSNDNLNGCAIERHRIPILDGKYPQSLSIKSSGRPIFLSVSHSLAGDSNGYVQGDVDIYFKVHASVMDKAYYGLNVTNSIIDRNNGNGILGLDVRERTALTNVTINDNQGQAGFLIQNGAADIWLNDTRIERNWGDGMNVTYAGGSITVNGTIIRENRWRGAAFHYNDSSPFIALHQEIIFKGRPSNNIFYLPSSISGNLWGGILVGNFCIPEMRRIEPKVLINWVELSHNIYHPSLEVHSCQGEKVGRTIVDVTGNRIEGNLGMGVRIAPAVNMYAVISSNHFLNNNETTLFIRNAEHPWLGRMGAEVIISKNSFKFNRARYIINIGLNEDSTKQKMTFNQQNEIRENTVYNPYPHLRPRSTPYAALVVSSSNVVINRNCFKNPAAEFEIATDLQEHAKWINARENNWGTPTIPMFMRKIFDQFNRYSLASIEVDPFAAVCNQRNSHITRVQEYFREFKRDSQPFVLGGTIFENHDLQPGRYTVTDDLHIVPGAKLTIPQGSVLEFHDGVGMLVQGELLLTDYHNGYHDTDKKVLFTSKPYEPIKNDHIRLVDEDGNDGVTEGRVEVFVDDHWGTVCNRSWTAHHALMVCNQLGMAMDPEYFENWRIFPPSGDVPIVIDNIRCEENEVDITKCRYDGVKHNVQASCRPTEVAGIRCVEPRWAGVRYSLLANPPTVTGQETMKNWIIEKAGLFDFRKPKFSPALQIDWNYHTFENVEIRNNFWTGLDIVYNDLTKKPTIRNSVIRNNRRHGIRLRSNGITVKNITVEYSGFSGVRYDSKVSGPLQRDIVSWLELREQPELEANNVFLIPDSKLSRIEVMESQLNQRKFLVAKTTEDCPFVIYEPCVSEITIDASGYEYGLASKIAIQIVHPVGNASDEDAVFWDTKDGKQFSVRKDQIHFPIVSRSNQMKLRYTRSYGQPKMIVLVLFLDAQEYLDRFVHVYESRIQNNQYGVSSVHYSNLSYSDGTVTNRYAEEKLWFQKVNFTNNREGVLWMNSPQHEVKPGTPIAEITYHIDNCTIANNTGALIETHRDLFASGNVFHWNFWSNTFEGNRNGGVSIRLPDTYDLLAKQTHTFWMTENRFQNNHDFGILVHGYYCFANISSNNFTDNYSRKDFGIMEISGMEKDMFVERNRWFSNWGNWMLKLNMQSQTIRNSSKHIPAFIQYNYFQHNHFIKSTEDYIDMWPRSYAIGIFGTQKADIHFNRLKNVLMDFELIGGCKPIRVTDSINATFNWWGSGNDAEISQRVFDFDDWNTYTLAEYSPFYVTEELFLDFWWRPRIGQLATSTHIEPSVHDLKGRMYKSKNMSLIIEKWHEFPFYYKPFRPYRITRDLTIMPGATLTIEKGVEVHIWPNVRILVLGDLVADGTYWEPIRFKPLNTTELDEIRGKVGTRYKRNVLYKTGKMRRKRSDIEWRISEWQRKKRAIDRSRSDSVYASFPPLHRDDPFYQRFTVSLQSNQSITKRAGFLEIYNATTGEIIPSCDRQFTIRNAQVVCRELGYPTLNAYHWITPRWEYNPLIRILKTYMEPRECRGDEERLDRCPLRLSGNTSQWQCMDNEHFNYVYCGKPKAVNNNFIDSWGGISFAREELEISHIPTKDYSVLKNVEIVGGGQGHNDTFQGGSLLIFNRSPILDHLNVTNSSQHGIEIISPRDKVILNRVNVTDNYGRGVSIVTTNLQGNSGDPPVTPLQIPYYSRGMIDMCSAAKRITVEGRVILYYKYDSQPVDCVKSFSSRGKKLSFRFLQVNFYSSPTDLGRSDALRVYSSDTFHPNSLLAEYRKEDEERERLYPSSSPLSLSVSSDSLSLHLRATAADGHYGFIAEVTATPTPPDPNPVDEVVIRGSRIDNNDQGAIVYVNTGEMSPSIVIEDCSLSDNGIHLYGNISTSMNAVHLTLHNTQLLLFRGNSLVHNRGGLFVSSRSSSAVARLNAIVKNNLFTANTNSTVLEFLGNNYQKVTMLNNIISYNYALYHDTVLARNVAVNMTKNMFTNNTGLHTVDVHGYSRVSPEAQTFLYNNFEANVALGHGHQYMERYGYQTEMRDEFMRRPKRQVLTQEGVSFDWWTHLNGETERYRSTILAGSAQQHYKGNVFNNPRNDYELTTSPQSAYENGEIDARMNYWGYPGTEGVAAGKIRDQEDFKGLIKVNYHPVLESNTSLIEGDCPAGWFQTGYNEFKSCYLFVGAAATYERAVQYCEEMDAFLPYLQADDVRQKELAKRIDEMSREYLTDQERYSTLAMMVDTHFWISSSSVPSIHCGFLSAKNGVVSLQNCGNLLPFVCERGTRPYSSPALWRKGVVVGVVLLAVCLGLLFLLCLCWCIKSRRRKDEIMERKNIIRASMKLQKKQPRFESAYGPSPSHESTHASLSASFLTGYEDPFAHRPNLRAAASAKSPTETERTSCSGSLSTDHTYETTTGYGNTGRTTESSSRPTDYSTSEGYYSSHVPSRTKVSRTPNPYSEITSQCSTFQGGGKVKLRPQSVHDTSCSSGATPTDCSTCPTDRESTVTDGSWSEHSSQFSDNTVQNKPLVPKRDRATTLQTTFSRAGTQRKDDLQKMEMDYGKKRELERQTTTTRSNPSLYSALPVVPPSVPIDNRQMGQQRRTGQIQASRHAPPPPLSFSNPPPPTRSLVDLYNPHLDSQQNQLRHEPNRYSTRKPMVETSM